MVNLGLLTGSSLFSGFGMGLLLHFVCFYVNNFENAIVYSAFFYLSCEASKFLFSFLAGFFVDRFKKKTILVCTDLALAFFVVFSFFYISNFSLGIYSFIIGGAIFGIIKILDFVAKQSTMPFMFKDELLIRANALDISIPKMALVFSYVYFSLHFQNKKGLLVFVVIVLFLVSAILKSFLVIKEVKIEKDNSSDVGICGIKSSKERKSVWLLILISIISYLFFITFIVIVVPNILKLGGHQSELEAQVRNYVQKFPVAQENIRILIKAFWVLFVGVFTFAGSMFMYMFTEKTLPPINKLLAKFMVAFSFVLSCFSTYDMFFNGIDSFMSNIGYIKVNDIQHSINMLFIIVGTMGVLLSILFFQIFGRRYDLFKGIKVTTYMLIPISLIMFCIVGYFAFLGKGNILQLATCLTLLLTLFYFTLNSQEIYITTFFQERVPFSRSSRFFSVLAASYVVAKNLGSKLYAITDSAYGLTMFSLLLVVISILTIFILKLIEKNINKKD